MSTETRPLPQLPPLEQGIDIKEQLSKLDPLTQVEYALVLAAGDDPAIQRIAELQRINLRQELANLQELIDLRTDRGSKGELWALYGQGQPFNNADYKNWVLDGPAGGIVFSEIKDPVSGERPTIPESYIIKVAQVLGAPGIGEGTTTAYSLDNQRLISKKLRSTVNPNITMTFVYNRQHQSCPLFLSLDWREKIAGPMLTKLTADSQ